jgi:hypothetical protein
MHARDMRIWYNFLLGMAKGKTLFEDLDANGRICLFMVL